jgi:uncharacterized membrane protein YcaP (DUF421 family)
VLFESWSGLGRILLVGVLAYVALVVILRISGKRVLTKLNAFDLVITVALGSTLSAVLLDKSVPLVEGVLGLALLVFLQFAITWLSVRSRPFSRLVKSEPTLLLHKGRLLDGALVEQRVTREEVLAALRAQGAADPAEVAAVVLETDGSMSVIARADFDARHSEGEKRDRVAGQRWIDQLPSTSDRKLQGVALAEFPIIQAVSAHLRKALEFVLGELRRNDLPALHREFIDWHQVVALEHPQEAAASHDEIALAWRSAFDGLLDLAQALPRLPDQLILDDARDRDGMARGFGLGGRDGDCQSGASGGSSPGRRGLALGGKHSERHGKAQHGYGDPVANDEVLP